MIDKLGFHCIVGFRHNIFFNNSAEFSYIIVTFYIFLHFFFLSDRMTLKLENACGVGIPETEEDMNAST